MPGRGRRPVKALRVVPGTPHRQPLVHQRVKAVVKIRVKMIMISCRILVGVRIRHVFHRIAQKTLILVVAMLIPRVSEYRVVAG